MRINVTADMMANLRFAYSPLVELTVSYRVLKRQQPHAIYWRWLEEAQRAISGLDLPYMDALINEGWYDPQTGLCIGKGYIPDFLTPTPIKPITDIEDEFNRLCHMDVEVVRHGLQLAIEFYGPSDILCYFLAYPRDGMACLIAELREYWKRTLAHHWNRMISVLENDILHHSRVLTLHGSQALFPELDKTLEYVDGAVVLNHIKRFCQTGNVPMEAYLDQHKRLFGIEIVAEHEAAAGAYLDGQTKPEKQYTLDGENLYLVPVIFSGNMVYHQLYDPWEPMILYTARGAGLWNYETPEPSEALEMTLGAGKARLLLALTNPLSSGELANKLSLTAGAVSQQLGKLHQAGLVESHRSGKHVFYRLTRRGHNLVDLFF